MFIKKKQLCKIMRNSFSMDVKTLAINFSSFSVVLSTKERLPSELMLQAYQFYKQLDVCIYCKIMLFAPRYLFLLYYEVYCAIAQCSTWELERVCSSVCKVMTVWSLLQWL